ncbi:hypothetical protein QR680_004942 [Steinernema hermaphroditum]|uniref:Uncharacterized protein n=1 Tax=Steinernema hermaphroditum TaxID=289476 RepID=A0AA39HSI7_9BILA|nr:hypothetical protein QR680_004942 [Steinernema hermaphroditum]
MTQFSHSISTLSRRAAAHRRSSGDMQLLRLIILLFCLSPLVVVRGDEGVTEAPISYRTGKLNQFKGFATPRPIPANAQFMYASVWASWSAWSFCVNNMQVRVRACNTVRGFSCLGNNQEHKACDHPQNSITNRFEGPVSEHDYDAVDPYEDDRKEAMRQLYSDYVPEVPQKPLPLKKARTRPPMNFAAARGPGRTVTGPLSPPQIHYGGPGPQGPPKQFVPPPQHRGPARAPSMTPELLFGSKLEPSSNPSNPPPPAPEGLTDFSGNKTQTTLTHQEEVAASKPASEEESHPTHAVKEESAATSLTPPTVPESTSEVKTSSTTTSSSSPPQTQESSTKTEVVKHRHSSTTSSKTSPSSSAATKTPKPEKSEGHPVMSKILEEPKATAPTITTTTTTTTPTSTTTTKAPETTTVFVRVVKPHKAVPEARARSDEEPVESTATVVKHLHSGEVALEDKRLLTTDTERALSWMLANMTKTAEDYEYDDEELVKKQKNLAELEEKLHSGEVVFPVLKPNRNDKYKIKTDTDFKRRVFAQKIHQTFEDAFTRTTESPPAWDAPHDHHAALVQPLKNLPPSFPIGSESNVRRAPEVPPSTPIKSHVSLTPSNQVRQLLRDRSPLRRVENPTKVELVQAIEGFKQDESEEQDALKQEIDKLRAMMHDMESQIERIKKDESSEKVKPEKSIESRVSVVEVDQNSHMAEDAREKAINLNLVPSGPRTKSEPLPPIISKSEANAFFVRASEQSNGEAHWSEWNPWNECFCNKQVRTRVCRYDDAFHSKGCEGKSYESRACVGTRPCPALQVKKITTPSQEEASTPEFYTLAPPARRRNGYAFKPNPLSVAVNRIGS